MIEMSRNKDMEMEDIKKVRTDLNDGSGNYILEIFIGEVLESKTLCNAANKPLEELIFGDTNMKNTYVYDEHGREIEFKQYDIDEDGYEELILQSFTRYDSQGRVVEAMYEDIEEIYEHLFFTYSEVNGKTVQHIFDEEHTPLRAEDVNMLNWALIDRPEEPELRPIQSSRIAFGEAVNRIHNLFKKLDSDNLIEVTAPKAACQVKVDDWNDKVLVVTYVFYDGFDFGKAPEYLLGKGEGGLYHLRYNWPSEMSKLFSQMKDILKVEDKSTIGYDVWY